jgi:hypothetical protein
LQQGFGIVAAEKHMGVLQSQGAPALGQPLANGPLQKAARIGADNAGAGGSGGIAAGTGDAGPAASGGRCLRPTGAAAAAPAGCWDAPNFRGLPSDLPIPY